MRIGVDIGGTKILGGLIDEGGHVHDRFRLKSKDFSSPRALTEGVGQQLLALLQRNGLQMANIEHFGVGIPGTADWLNGRVIYSPNLLGENVPLGNYLEEAVGVRPTIVQDSWAGAYAEYRFGQQGQYQDMMCITLGTGIGCGIIQGGKVYSGLMHTAGEIGHVSIAMDGRPCSCGKRGCLETYASGTGIYAQAMEQFPEKLKDAVPGAEAVFDLAYQGDAQAIALLAQCTEYLAFGLAALIDITACNVIFISGGLSSHDDYMIAPLGEAIRRRGYPAWSKRIAPLVRKAALGCDAPLIGAAFLDAARII